ncbi:XdhC family protein [Rhodococcus sp. NPDC003318]|uniref:XdhC family protein n=1 Tax=Rhodococcus sp. NPDC003318 TaxID=3364503 RepID=UPI00369E020A
MRTDARIADLVARRQPFVHATVVRAESPTSARTGDEGVVLGDGTIDGFVGGQCARNSVREAAIEALREGEPVLLRVLPDGAPDFPDVPGARVVVNPCLSGGALEIFLQPTLPPPRLVVAGDNPIADALTELAGPLGFEVTRAEPEPSAADAEVVVIASLGGDEPARIRAALDSGAGYIGLVASTIRGADVLGRLDLDVAERSRIHTPAGLPIGARTPAEIALAVLAEIVRETRNVSHRPVPAEPTSSIDPVCGMSVVPGPDAVAADVDGVTVWFCGPGCRDRYVREHAR